MEYTWKIDHISVKNSGDLQDAVFRVHWWKSGVDEDGNEGRYYGASQFDLSNLDPETFVPFDEITEDIMLGWITSSITAEIEMHHNAMIQKAIDDSKNPERVLQAPWLNS